MLSFLRWFDILIICIILFFLALGLIKAEPTNDFTAINRTPRNTESIREVNPNLEPSPSAVELSHLFGVRVDQRLPVTSTIKEIPNAVQPRIKGLDKTSIEYLGTMTDAGDQQKYFFKMKNSGRLITLVPGRKIDGFLLTEITATYFRVKTGEYEYEVAR